MRFLINKPGQVGRVIGKDCFDCPLLGRSGKTHPVFVGPFSPWLVFLSKGEGNPGLVLKGSNPSSHSFCKGSPAHQDCPAPCTEWCRRELMGTVKTVQ